MMPSNFNDLLEGQKRATEAMARIAGTLGEPSTARPAGVLSGLGDPSSAPHPAGDGRAELLEVDDGSVDIGRGLRQAAGALQALGGDLAANTSALKVNAEATTSMLSGLARGLLGGSGVGGGLGGLLKSGLGLAPIGSALFGLFSGKKDEVWEQPTSYELPASFRVEAANGPGPVSGLSRAVGGASEPVRTVTTPSSPVVVNINAMDSRSFLDRSSDIAQAVRDAMIHMHPVNDVIDEL